MDFCAFFQDATGKTPFAYQERLAQAPELPAVLHVPTGAGKTAAVILGWLWRRRYHPDPAVRAATPRRLAYALPMRVLVEQTFGMAGQFLDRLKEDDVRLSLLLGGALPESAAEWWLHPEDDAIVIGTQDMLLSRALNRGYGVSRFRWPIDFALLHSDCLWVLDEIQLMGAGLATSAQLAGLRDHLGCCGPARTLWLSATLDTQWLNTIDHPAPRPETVLQLDDADLNKEALRRRLQAPKSLQPASQAPVGADKAALKTYARELAEAVVAAHRPASLTLVVMNTVERAVGLYRQLQDACDEGIEILLIHARFRPPERGEHLRRLLGKLPPGGRVVVSTQVVEAGVDISAATLFTELAPWPSLVQRFGRCNRYGDDAQAVVYWLDLPDTKLAPPYAAEDLAAARRILSDIGAGGSVAPAAIGHLPPGLQLTPHHVLRRRDLVELFDTTPDLSGNDLDVSRYIRATDDLDVQVFWRQWDEPGRPPADLSEPGTNELCSVPARDLATFLKARQSLAWRWDHLDELWEAVRPDAVRPGQVLLLASDLGGYRLDTGWSPESTETVTPRPRAEQGGMSPEGTRSDRAAAGNWVLLQDHTQRVVAELAALLNSLTLAPAYRDALRTAARWHDLGKGHPVFQQTLTSNDPTRTGQLWAKAPATGRRHRRRYFRHELASALAAFAHLPRAEPWRDLILYLIAAHHGRVRLSIRSLPGEQTAPEGRRVALGIQDGDLLPATDLGGGLQVPEIELNLAPMDLGGVAGEPSWLERMLALQADLGPLRLAYLEALLRIADMRASRREREEEGHG